MSMKIDPKMILIGNTQRVHKIKQTRKLSATQPQNFFCYHCARPIFFFFFVF